MIKLAYSYAKIENPSDKEDFASLMQEDLEKHYGTGKATVEASGEEYIITIDGRGTYKIKQDGTVEKAGPTIVATLTGVKVVNSSGTEVATNSTDPSTTTLFISFGVTVDKGTITSVTDSNGTVLTATEGVYSYEVSSNGDYRFIVNATVEGENASNTTDAVTVNQFAVRAGIQVGDYINYTPAGGTFEISKLNTYSGTSNGSEDLTLTNMGTLDWQVLRIYDDGRMDLIGSPTSKYIYFKGALGYNNGVYLMNDICKTLYSRTGIEARSVNLEDVEYWLTDDKLNSDGTVKTKGGKTAKKESINDKIMNFTIDSRYAQSKDTTKNTVTYQIESSYYPDLYQYEKGAGINTTTVNTTGIRESDDYYTGGYDPTKEKAMISVDGNGTSYFQANVSGLTVEQSVYEIDIITGYFGDGSKVFKNLNSYFLASRYRTCTSDRPVFGFCMVVSSGKNGFGGIGRCYTSGNGRFIGNDPEWYVNSGGQLRPVVQIGADTEVTPVSGASSSASTPHQITKY